MIFLFFALILTPFEGKEYYHLVYKNHHMMEPIFINMVVGSFTFCVQVDDGKESCTDRQRIIE